MKQFLLVFLGGGIGSMARYAVGRWLNTLHFPLGTLSVNIIGSLIIGAVFGYFIKENSVSHNLVLILATGFCGGFTTFSAFSFENLQMLKEGQFGNFILYVLTSIILALLAVWIGFKISENF